MANYDALKKAVEAAQIKRQESDFPKLEDGYTFKADGRSGFVYYKEGDHILEIYWEMSGVPECDVLISPLEITTWTRPEKKAIPSEKRKQIIDGLRDYLLASRIRPDF